MVLAAWFVLGVCNLPCQTDKLTVMRATATSATRNPVSSSARSVEHALNGPVPTHQRQSISMPLTRALSVFEVNVSV